MKPKAAILFTSGTNCDYETSLAFEMAGGDPVLFHTSDLKNSNRLRDFQMIIIPGGFSYGDHLGSATIWANELSNSLGEELMRFLDSDKLIIGICNGFQALVKLGILPGLSGRFSVESTLTDNFSGKFESRWVRLKVNPNSPCIFTKGLDEIEMPVAHGEGNFTPKDLSVFSKMIKNNQITMQYVDENGSPAASYPKNPNGSFAAIAGICDPSGRAFGLMPHPERFIYSHQRFLNKTSAATGILIYKNAVNHFKTS